MKKILLLLFLANAFVTSAQYKYYKDSTFSTPFLYLPAGTSVNNGQSWNKNTDYKIPVGFAFKFFGHTVDTFYANQQFGSGAWLFTTPRDIVNTTHSSAIVVHGSELRDRDTTAGSGGSQSPISYSLTGIAPNRIFKAEWRNAGFQAPILNGTSYADSVNFQLWLHETTNMIDIVFGTGNYVSSDFELYGNGAGPSIAIFDSLDWNNITMKQFYYFNGPVATPYLDSLTDFGTLSTSPCMTGNPSSGSVFRFKPQSILTSYNSVNKQMHSNVSYFPQANQLTIDIYEDEQYDFKLIDVNGRVISTKKIGKGREIISTSDLASGFYAVHIMSKHERQITKFVR